MRRSGLAAAVCAALLITALPATSSADELQDQKRKLAAEMAETKAQISEFSGEVANAVAAYEASKTQLADAEAKLAKAESDTRAAKDEDAKRAADLKAAELALKAAQAEVVAAKQALADEKGETAEAVRENIVGLNPLTELAFFLDDLKTSDIGGRMQYTQAVFGVRSDNIDRLVEAQIRLEAAEQKAHEAEDRATLARQEAARQLAHTRSLENAASDARTSVANLVASNASLKKNAETKLASAESDYAQQQADDAALDARIKQRIEEAKRKAAAEAKRKADEEAKRKAQQANSGSGSSGSSGSGYSPSTSLKWPAIGRPGSPFGMRYHPILKYNRMHWGTDIGAACGSPLYAADDGVVTERYYNSGYGNRLVLDIGQFQGSYLSIGYAHATRYVVGVGQRVSKGQVIGYVGSTGLSTECHLHLEVWQNGTKVNPMKFF